MLLRYLHISDLHLTGPLKEKKGSAIDQFNQDMVTNSMTEKMKELVEKEGKNFDLICITGDLAMSGKPNDYEVVKLFCDRLLNATGVPPARFFIVPGNHDVDRDKVDINQLKFGTEDEITGKLHSTDALRELALKFDPFNDFAENAMGLSGYKENRYFFVKTVPITAEQQTILLNMVGLNSALFAGYDGDDRQKLALGLPQVNEALNKLDKQALLTIVMFHHPFACFHAADKVCRNLLMQKSDIILTGHQHEPENMCVSSGAGKAVFISAGACFENRESANSFNVVEINLATGAGKVQFYKYLPDHNQWKENTDANPRDKQGIFFFEIDRIKPKDDVASANTGIRLLKDLIVKVPEVADAVSRSKEVIENTYRQVDKLELFKTIHDALHTIEFECLRPLQAGGAATRLRPFKMKFAGEARRIQQAIQERKMNATVRDDLVDQLELDRLEPAEASFQSAVDAPSEAAFGRVVSELNSLLSGAPPQLDDRISATAGELNLDRLGELMTKVRSVLPATPNGGDAELDPFLRGIEAINRLRDELTWRVLEHTQLQCLDSKLRTVCVAGTGPGALAREWVRIKRVRSRLAPPFSAELQAVNEDLAAIESEIETAVERGDEHATLDLLREYFRSVSTVFQEVDRSLRGFCIRLSAASQPLKTILSMY